MSSDIRLLMHAMESVRSDPRYFQIICLSVFLIWGKFFDYLDVSVFIFFVHIISSLCFQLIGVSIRQKTWLHFKTANIPGWQSALITSLSLCLLFRSNHIELSLLVTAIAINSKFFITYRRHHFFNPTNLAIVIMLFVFSDRVWISPGQWGHDLLFVIAISGLGLFISQRSARIDVALVFLSSYTLILAARAIYLQDPWQILMHQLQDGALLLFAFFMITDPKTSPDHPIARIMYALSVAGIAYTLKFHFYITESLFYALVLTSVCLPIINRLLPSKHYQWHGQVSTGK
jgi:Na+-transporting NADH:ubiquinone oxidoreductase subunit NqrB